MRTVITAIFIFLSFGGYSQSSDKDAIIKRATDLMDNGFPDDAIAILEEAKKQDSKDFIYDYEIGFALNIKKDYKEALKRYKMAVKYDNATDQCYQMLGNLYDMTGDPDKAIKAYKEGLKKFPNSGRLYLEQGIIFWNQKNMDAAVSLFEKGIEVDPTYPSNYYNLAKSYLNSEEKAWGMVYGEQFMNLERNTLRTENMSKWLYDAYKSGINIKSDTTLTVSFSRNVLITVKGMDSLLNIKNMFGMTVYEPVLSLSVVGEKEITINSLDRIRARFIKTYFSRNFDKKYPVSIFDLNKKIIDAGHYEAYNHWLLVKGDEEAFFQWQSENEEKWTSFVEWYNKN